MMLDNKILPTPLVMVFVGIAVIAILYFPTLSVFHLRWSEQSSAFSHGYLLVPLSLWLMAQEWMERKPPLHMELLPVLLMAIISFSWFAGRMVSVEFVEQSAVILLAALLIPTLIGHKHSFRLLLPILFLFTTVPILERVAGGLQELTAIVSGILLNVVGVRTFQDGYLLMIPAGSFKVDPSCSGIRYQIAAISLTLIDAYMSRMVWRYFIAYILLAMFTAFVGNSIRILIIISVAQLTDMETSLVDDHIWLGWVIFAILIPLMMWLWHKNVGFNVIKENVEFPTAQSGLYTFSFKNTVLLIVLVLAVALGPVLSLVFQQKRGNNIEFSGPPDYVLNDRQWKSAAPNKSYWEPEGLLPDVSMQKKFVREGELEHEAIDIFSGYFAIQSNDREAINVVNKVFNKKSWLMISRENDVAVGSDDLLVEESVLRRGGGYDRLVWRWYNVGGKSVGNPTLAKIYNFRSSLLGRSDITSHIIATDIVENKNTASVRMRDFLDSNNTIFNGWVKQVRTNQNNPDNR